MVSNATIITCIVSLLVSTVLPIGLLIVYTRKNKGQKIVSAWLLGAAGFFVTQVLIRVPLLSILQTKDWFLSFSQNHLFLFAFLLAFTAGLFELAGRFAVAKLMEKQLTFHRSFSAGLGHGGIEAIVLIASGYITNLVFIIMINTGTFHSLIAEAAAAGVDTSQLNLLADTLIHSSPALYLLGGFERILAMTCHVGMTMIVSFALYRKKPLLGALVCLTIHTMIDLSAGINMLSGSVLSQTAAYIIIYTMLTATAAASVWIIRKIHICWTE